MHVTNTDSIGHCCENNRLLFSIENSNCDDGNTVESIENQGMSKAADSCVSTTKHNSPRKINTHSLDGYLSFQYDSIVYLRKKVNKPSVAAKEHFPEELFMSSRKAFEENFKT